MSRKPLKPGHLELINQRGREPIQPPRLLAHIQKNTLSHCEQLLAHLFSATDDLFYDLSKRASSNNEQNLYFEAMREIRVRREGIANRFLRTQSQNFSDLIDANTQGEFETWEREQETKLSIVDGDDLDRLGHDRRYSLSSDRTEALGWSAEVGFEEGLERTVAWICGLPHLRGAVGMARAEDPDSANSQFYIMFTPRTVMDDDYTVFGRVVSGMNHVDGIARGEPPLQPTRIVRASLGSDNLPPPTPEEIAAALQAGGPGAGAQAPPAARTGPAIPAPIAGPRRLDPVRAPERRGPRG